MLIVLGLLCLDFSSFGQQNTLVKAGRLPLLVGEMVPDITITNLLNYPSTTAGLADFSDKLLILDFWATWCSSCITAIPKNENLKREVGNQLEIVSITNEPASLILSFLKKNSLVKDLRPVIATNDTLFSKLFPFQFLPHLVWIYKGRYLGATEAEYLNSLNVKRVLTGQDVMLDRKKDIRTFNPKEPLFAVDNHQALAGLQPLVHSTIGTYIDGLPLKAGTVIDTLRHTRRMYFINTPVVNLYAAALGSPLPFISSRRILEIPDLKKFEFVKGDQLYKDWAKLNCYTWEGTASSELPASILSRELLSSVDHLLGFHGRIEKRKVSCLVIRSIDPKAASKFKVQDIQFAKTGASVYFHYIKPEDLVYHLNQLTDMPFVIDESRTAFYFDFNVRKEPHGSPEWEQLLKAQGIEVSKEDRMLDVFALTANAPIRTTENNAQTSQQP